ncbi:hypothetical protein LINPERPRIM_LOCUS22545 [Linum perenne]
MEEKKKSNNPPTNLPTNLLNLRPFLLASILIIVILAFIAFKPRNPIVILFPFGFKSLSLTDLIISKKDIGENDLKSRRRRVLRRRRGPNIGERDLPPSATPVPPSSF